MKGYFKENLAFLASIVLAVSVLCFLQFTSCGSSQDLEDAAGKVKRLQRSLSDTQLERAGFEGVEDNLELARKDNEGLLENRIGELKKWKEILGRENLFDGVSKKSSDDVNAEISRFLDRHRKEAVENGLTIRGASEASSDSPGLFPGGGPEIEDREGFGFSGYDGAWPSISDEEARGLLKQKLILEKLLAALFKSRPDDEPLEILGLRRETVGEVDEREAGGEALAIEPLAGLLAKRKGRIETYAFEIRFEARTHALRTFLNTLSHPFLIRDVKVRRVEDSGGSFSGGPGIVPPFGSLADNAPNSTPLPVITDVGSRFQVTVEYVLAVHSDPVDFLKAHYPEKPPPENMLSDFLEASGFDGEAAELVQSLYPKQDE